MHVHTNPEIMHHIYFFRLRALDSNRSTDICLKDKLMSCCHMSGSTAIHNKNTCRLYGMLNIISVVTFYLSFQLPSGVDSHSFFGLRKFKKTDTGG